MKPNRTGRKDVIARAFSEAISGSRDCFGKDPRNDRREGVLSLFTLLSASIGVHLRPHNDRCKVVFSLFMIGSISSFGYYKWLGISMWVVGAVANKVAECLIE